MNTSKNILLITSEFPPNVGGIGNHAYNLAKALSEEGYPVTVIADIIEVSEEDQVAFAKQQSFDLKFITRQPAVFKTYLNRIKAALALSAKADIVICSNKFPLWLGILLRLFRKARFVAIVHGSELDIKSSFPRKLTAFALQKFHTIISVSNYTADHLPKNLPGSIRKVIIHNGINIREYTKPIDNLLQGEPALVTVGNVTPRKGQENVINALPGIKQQFEGVKYHVIGKPTTREKLQARCKELKLSETVQFHGAVSRPELLQKLSSAKVKLMLSNHTPDGDFEGFGIAVLEANAFGVPVIGSRNSGIADAIEDNKTGILVDPKNSNEVSTALKKILNNYSYFSSNAKEWALQHDWKIIVKEYIKVLEQA